MIPYERTQSIAELREGDRRRSGCCSLAREDGVVVGSGLAQPLGDGKAAAR